MKYSLLLLLFAGVIGCDSASENNSRSDSKPFYGPYSIDFIVTDILANTYHRKVHHEFDGGNWDYDSSWAEPLKVIDRLVIGPDMVLDSVSSIDKERMIFPRFNAREKYFNNYSTDIESVDLPFTYGDDSSFRISLLGVQAAKYIKLLRNYYRYHTFYYGGHQSSHYEEDIYDTIDYIGCTDSTQIEIRIRKQ